MRRLTCQRGSAAIDYLGVLAVAGTIAALLVISAPAFAQKIVCGIQNELAKLGLASPCSAASTDADNTPCLVSDSSGTVKLELTVFSVQGGGQVKILRQEYQGGEVRITLSGGGKLGFEVGEGGEVSLDTGGGGGGGGEGVRGGANVNGELGGTWVFPSDDAADEFVDIVRNKARDTFLDTTLPPVGWINHLIGTDEDRSIPAPDISYLQGGLGAGVKGEDGPASFGFESSAVLGVRVDHRTGEKTTYLQLNAGGEAGVAEILGIDVKGDLEGQLAVTVDKDGKPIKATIIGKGSVDSPIGLTGTINNPSELLSKLKFNAKGGSGGRIEFQGDLDLTQPGNLDAFNDFMSNPLTGALGLGRAMLDNGKFNARAYKTDRSKYGPSVKGSDIVEFGFEGSYETIDSDLVGAWKWSKADGFSRWVTCTG